MSSEYGLIFAWGPAPHDPVDARMLGCEEAKLGGLLDTGDAFRVYVHAASIPELVAYVRARGRDCTYEPFAERQALLIVKSKPTDC